MEPFVIISDTHFHNWAVFSSVNEHGINSRLIHSLQELERAYEHASAIGARRIFHGGDVFHVRGIIPPSVLTPLKETIMRCYEKTGVELVLMNGNHDLEFNDKIRAGGAALALSELEGVTVLDSDKGEDVSMFFPDEGVVMVPWRDSLDELRICLAELSVEYPNSNAIVHAPVDDVIEGIPNSGLTASELQGLGFRRVFAGHYHNFKDLGGGVYSIGALTHQTWGDVGTKAGTVVVERDRVRHIEAKAPKFVRYEPGMTSDAVNGNFVKVVLQEATESEIQGVKDTLKKQGAAAIVVEAVREQKLVERDETVAVAGESLAVTATNYIDSRSDLVSDRAKLKERVLAALKQAEGELA